MRLRAMQSSGVTGVVAPSVSGGGIELSRDKPAMGDSMARGMGSGGASRSKGSNVRTGRLLRRVILPAVGTILLAIAWEVAALVVGNGLLMPSVPHIVAAFATLLTGGTLWSPLWISMKDLGEGLGISFVLGVALGVALGRSSTLGQMFDPIVNFFNATPMVALLPVLIVWFGLDYRARVAYVVALTILTIVINVEAGIRACPLRLHEVGVVYRLSQWQSLRWIAIPSATPYVLAGIRIAIGRAVIGMIIAEMETKEVGLGGLLNLFGNSFEMGRLLGLVLVTSIVGVVLVGVLRMIEMRWFSWVSDTGSSGARRRVRQY